MIEKIKNIFTSAGSDPIFILETDRCGDTVDNGYGVEFDLPKYAVIHRMPQTDGVKRYIDIADKVMEQERELDIDTMKFDIKGCSPGIIENLGGDGYKVIWQKEGFSWDKKDEKEEGK
jgi:hypothetical protein